MEQPAPIGWPLIYGEVLFDLLPDNREIPGGAPFNVAWHLQGLGCTPLLISRVGRDERGDRLLRLMADWGMDTSGIQRDHEYPTGTVKVTLPDGQPHFEIRPDQAFDYLTWPEIAHLLDYELPALLYHGSLIARLPVSANILFRLLSTGEAPVFMDVNLRDPWWTMPLIQNLMHGARWIKVNAQELALLNPDAQTADDAARDLRTGHGAESLIVTDGERGAWAIGADDVLVRAPAPQVDEIIDTVGAGDAFSAVCICGILHRWPLATILARAAAFATEICRIPGATSADRTLYNRYRSEWELPAEND